MSSQQAPNNQPDGRGRRVGDHDFGGGPDPRRLAVAALVPAAAAWVALGADALVQRELESEACAFALAAAILGFGAVVIGAPPAARWLAPLSRHLGPIIGLYWIGVAAIPAATFAPNGWDESAYLLSGLSTRGYPTPYAAHRPPVTALICALFADVPR
jgi:uncharacterized membrane protein YedE/YeeE